MTQLFSDNGQPKSLKTRLPLVLADGTAEALKWLALVLMVLDHVNQYLYHSALPWVFPIARISFPLFGFVLAYNLARPETISNGAAVRVMKRLGMFALVSATPHIIMDGRFFPLNILATLLVATGAIYLIEQGGLKRWLGILVFVAGGCIVEDNWFAVAVCITADRYCQSPMALRLSSFMFSLAVLGFSSTPTNGHLPFCRSSCLPRMLESA